MRNLLRAIFFIFATNNAALAKETIKVKFIDLKTSQPVTEILVGRAVAIQIEGLAPHSQITLKCDNQVAQSEAQFAANAQGKIDLSQQAPLSGSYAGVDPDGMFWSRSKMANIPVDTKPGPLNCRVFDKGIEVSSSSLTKIFRSPEVQSQRITKKETGFEALFSKPAGPGPFPALFLVSGSEGGLDDFSAEYFASLGYATLSVAYFAMPGLPNDIHQIPLEYFKTGIDWLKSQKSVDPKRVGLYGVSRGGELALALASTFPEDFAAVIANEPSGVAWASYKEGDNRQRSSWTYKNQDLPAVPFTDELPHTEISPDGRKIVTYSNVFLAALKNKEAVQKAILPIEKFLGPLLILAGEADQIWPTCTLSQYTLERRKQFVKNPNDRYYCFADAGHTIGVPGWSLMDLTLYHPLIQEFLGAGGTPAGNAKAQRVGWDAAVQFLEQHLRDASKPSRSDQEKRPGTF